MIGNVFTRGHQKVRVWRTTQRLVVAVVLPAVLFFSAARCAEEPAVEDQPQGFIAVVGVAQDDALFLVLSAGAERASKLLGTYPIQFTAPAVQSPNLQVSLIRELQDQGMRGLCVQVMDSKAIAPLIKSLTTSGIPVVTMMKDAAVGIRTAFCGLDQFELGQEIAKETAAVVGDSGNIILMHAGDSDLGYRARLSGFNSIITQHPNIHVLASLDCHDDPDIGRRLVEDWGSRYPQVRAWAILDNWPMRFEGDRRVRFPKGSKIIAAHPFPPTWKYVELGECVAIVGAEYDRIGFEAYRFCLAAVKKRAQVERKSLVNLRVLRPADLDAYRLQWVLWSSDRRQ